MRIGACQHSSMRSFRHTSPSKAGTGDPTVRLFAIEPKPAAMPEQKMLGKPAVQSKDSPPGVWTADATADERAARLQEAANDPDKIDEFVTVTRLDPDAEEFLLHPDSMLPIVTDVRCVRLLDVSECGLRRDLI